MILSDEQRILVNDCLTRSQYNMNQAKIKKNYLTKTIETMELEIALYEGLLKGEANATEISSNE